MVTTLDWEASWRPALRNIAILLVRNLFIVYLFIYCLFVSAHKLVICSLKENESQKYDELIKQKLTIKF